MPQLSLCLFRSRWQPTYLAIGLILVVGCAGAASYVLALSSCMNQCATYGYTAAGVEASQKASLIFRSWNLLFSLVYNAVHVNCPISWSIVVDQPHNLVCGDIGDVVVNDGVFGAESECARLPWRSDPSVRWRQLSYYWNRSSLSNWKRPANTGFYEVSFIS